MDTDLVEFLQLQEVEVFSYLCYSLAKSHFHGWGCVEAWMAVFFGLKIFEPSGGNPYYVAMNSADPRVSLFT